MKSVDPIRLRSHVQAIGRFLKSWDWRYYLMFAVGVHTGLRISDILPLRFGDFIKEYQSGRRRWAERLLIREKKTRKHRKERSILIRGTALGSIVRETLKPITRWNLNDYVFLSHKKDDGLERPFGRWTAYHVLRVAGDRCGLEEQLGTHSMRKTFGYHFYRETKDVAERVDWPLEKICQVCEGKKTQFSGD